MSARNLAIVSWNVFALNTELPDALEFIRNLEWDVLCLQEVSDELLDMLHTLPFHIVSGIDNIWQADAWHPEKGENTMHLVILSKHLIEKSEAHPYPELPAHKPLQMRAYGIARYAINMWKGGDMRARTVLEADINIGGTSLQVFSAHLSLYTPQTRAAEFNVISQHIDHSRLSIVCGDFNILDNWLMKPLNWLQGGKFIDMMPWAPERKNMEKSFAAAQLANPLTGQVTHEIAQSQLDHILVSINTQVEATRVIHELHGSDHYPVTVSIHI